MTRPLPAALLLAGAAARPGATAASGSQRLAAALGSAARPKGVRARARLARGIGRPLLFTGGMPPPPPMRFGDAHDAGRRPQALRRAPRAPFAPAVLAGCAREGANVLFLPRKDMM